MEVLFSFPLMYWKLLKNYVILFQLSIAGKLIASGTMEEIKGQHSLEDVFMEVVENGKEI